MKDSGNTPGGSMEPFPPIAYILLWFPKPSETFIFAEVTSLREMGWPVTVFSLYGKLRNRLCAEMRRAVEQTQAVGLSAACRLPLDYIYWLRKKPRLVVSLFGRVLFRRWRNWEQAGENLWAFFAAFRVARQLEHSGVCHIHAPWATGPATAAWVASLLTGIPFSFAARAGDIYPQDGALADKIKAAEFVRSDNRTNVDYLRAFAGSHIVKVKPIYNGLLLKASAEAPVRMAPPLHLLGVGRFVRTKGFDVMLRAGSVLKDQGVDYRMTIVGDGPLRGYLRWLARRLGLSDRVVFPGFASYDEVGKYFVAADVFVMSSVIPAHGGRDGLPTVILEAFAHRVPVVATDVCGIREIVIPGRTGWLVAPGDPEALAGAIREAVADRERALALAADGRLTVRECFDSSRNHRALSDLFMSSGEQRRGLAGP